VRSREKSYLPKLSYGDVVRIKKSKDIAIVREEFTGAQGQRRIAIDVERWSVIVVGPDEIELLNKRTRKDVWNIENKAKLI